MIDEEQFKGIRILKLKRNERRMKQTSTTMLQSWRANCDVSVLIYNHGSASSISCTDIAAVVCYVVSYCTKGNLSFNMERDAIEAMITAAEEDFLEGGNVSTVSLVRKILNSFHSKRVITKAEASCELLNLPLYKCSERIVRVSLSSHTTIRKGSKRSKKQTQLESYATRLRRYKKMNFHDFFYSHIAPRYRDRDKRILVCTGLSGSPVYPVSYGYAKSSLILYKPWSKDDRLRFERKGDDRQIAIEEFNDFIQDADCPLPLLMSYYSARERHYKRLAKQESSTQFDPVQSDVIDEKTLNVIQAGQIFRSDKILSGMDRGLNYDWSRLIHTDIDPSLQCGSWLLKTKDEYLTTQHLKKNIPRKRNGECYTLEDVENDVTQSELVYTVIKKVKEWVEWPVRKDVSVGCRHLYITLKIKNLIFTFLSSVFRKVTSSPFSSQFKVQVVQEKVL